MKKSLLLPIAICSLCHVAVTDVAGKAVGDLAANIDGLHADQAFCDQAAHGFLALAHSHSGFAVEAFGCKPVIFKTQLAGLGVPDAKQSSPEAQFLGRESFDYVRREMQRKGLFFRL